MVGAQGLDLYGLKCDELCRCHTSNIVCFQRCDLIRSQHGDLRSGQC